MNENVPIDRAVDGEVSILCNIAPPVEQPADRTEVLDSESGHEMKWSNFVAVDGDSVQENLAQVPSGSRHAIEGSKAKEGAQSPEAVQNKLRLTVSSCLRVSLQRAGDC